MTLKTVLDNKLRTIVHIPNVNARESLKDKIKEAEGRHVHSWENGARQTLRRDFSSLIQPMAALCASLTLSMMTKSGAARLSQP